MTRRRTEGIAAEAAGKGYADTGPVLYGYDAMPAASSHRVVSMRETPELATRSYRPAS